MLFRPSSSSSSSSSTRSRQWVARTTPSSSGPQVHSTVMVDWALKINYISIYPSGGVSSGHAVGLGMSLSGQFRPDMTLHAGPGANH